jgi:predicted short-subunit dehydrogenase-like oxidoreductase (DUF2520 family)
MKIRISFLAIITIVFSSAIISSCHIGCIEGSGKLVTENRKISNFSKIDIAGNFTVNLKQDSSLTLTLTTDDNVMKYIRAEVNGNKLRIYTRKNLCNLQPITVNIGAKNIEEIKASGMTTINSVGRINTQNLKLKLAGVSKIKMDLSAADVETQGSGSTELNLTGQAASHKVDIAGVGELHALDFVVGSYNIKISGSGNSQINVLKSLVTHISGFSSIEYRGNPSEIDTNKAGASQIRKIQ